MMDPELRYILEQFDAFTANVRKRIVKAHDTYGAGWRGRDNLEALREENEDAYAYGFFDWLKTKGAH
ncbi:MAG TPA: hypothetical protein VM537_22335 [Anaerolineae bacterium]|nr:hypothetical protein [Anaerolineae bacterium]